MSYKLEYPYTEEERLEFIIEYNHNQGLKIETVERAILTEELSELVVDYYALEANEIMVDNEPVIDPDYEAKQEQKERERIAKLKCTKRVFALMLQELGIDYITVLLPLIESNPRAKLEWDLCVELERQNPLLDVMAYPLEITSEQLDGLFKYANGEMTIEEFREISSNPDVDNSEAVTEENSVVYDVTELEDVNNSDSDVNNTEVGETR